MAMAPTLTACIALETRYRRALRPSARKRPRASASIPGERIGARVVAIVAVMAGMAVRACVAHGALNVVVVGLDGARAAVAGRRGVRLAVGMRRIAVLRAGQPWLLARGDALHLLRDVNALVLMRSEEHTSELQSPVHLVCRLLLEKKIEIALRARRRTSLIVLHVL